MTHLSVNVNKIATLRNARGHDLPNVVQVSRDIIQFGADGITVHPRPDERHIKKNDVYELLELMNEEKDKNPKLEFNIEGYPSEDFLELIDRVRPDQCTLVPDPPHVITSNAGWSLVERKADLKKILQLLRDIQVRSSLFMDPVDNSPKQFEALRELNPDRIELYTEAFAKSYEIGYLEKTMYGYKDLARAATLSGIGINAGHDLNQKNLKTLLTEIPKILEVSIGHALICEALYQGLSQTIASYKNIICDCHGS
ncbi:MAG: pyridoxine 5'-phosphate synthase [Bdellovibrionales bacterium]|nr:pyridoxine 5'-phosphate synthase [Bdellovibrionales bacterium]